MRTIGIQEIEDIALGAALLGAGGGGDPYVGKLVAMGAVKECGPVTLLDPEEVPDDALLVPIAMMGAPTVLGEEGHWRRASTRPSITWSPSSSARRSTPSCPSRQAVSTPCSPSPPVRGWGSPGGLEGLGRAFPELQMVTFTIGGMSATPMALTDEKGNSVIFETITNKWTEELARAVTMSCGGSVSVSLYPMTGAQMKAYSVKNIVTRSQKLGEAIRTVKDCADDVTPEEHFLQFSEGYKLFKGKIADVLRETRGAFNFGKVMLEGIGECKGHQAYVEFQNENLTATVDGRSWPPRPT